MPSLAAWARGLPDETKGILCVIFFTLMFNCMDVFAKELTARYDSLLIVWARYASQMFWIIIAFGPRLPRYLKTRHPGLQILRSGFLFSATCMFFTGLSFLPLAESAATMQTAPLIITLLAALVLREQVGPRRWLGVAAGLLGALIIIRPGAEVFSLASLLPLGAAFCYAAYSVSTRLLNADESTYTTFIYTAAIGAIVASLIVPFYWTTPTLEDALIMLFFGIFGGLGHLALITGLQYASASALAPFNYSSLIWATALGFLAFGELPDQWTIIGALVIVSAGLYVWRRERIRKGVA